jgi:hypothetical protein
MTDFYRFKINNKKFDINEYLVIQDILSKDEKELMKEVVKSLERVDKEIERREEEYKRNMEVDTYGKILKFKSNY